MGLREGLFLFDIYQLEHDTPIVLSPSPSPKERGAWNGYCM